MPGPAFMLCISPLQRVFVKERKSAKVDVVDLAVIELKKLQDNSDTAIDLKKKIRELEKVII